MDRAVPFLVTDIASAELIKHASNSFLALKIAFANAVADVCEAAGADILQVVKGVGLDKRIGRAFLNAGIGFGGSCFPKDLKAFVKIAERNGYDFTLLKEVEPAERPAARAGRDEAAAGPLDPARASASASWGWPSNPTPTTSARPRRSPSRAACSRRAPRCGATIPRRRAKAQEAVPGLTLCPDPYAAAAHAEAVVLCTEWPEFAALDFARLKAGMVRPLLLDGRNALDREALIALGFEYLGIGRGTAPAPRRPA